ncbi:DNA polymerase delta, subunit 4-domain-containing protein [Leucosporidium creatinivorum]|uniref:DNA polymerase delta, subunit 4-domain-containing protein n=1 Tax=Leucosporidium creatinivorum TaxID=106004 RepID=A0A1Y2EZC0_9BASI|nr:DNA polymerase delta, subunit 4-domain-containing protein [Leucosporidium creatinivorum]
MAPKSSTTASAPKRRSSLSTSLTSSKPAVPSSGKSIKKSSSLTSSFSSAKTGAAPAGGAKKGGKQGKVEQIELDDEDEEEDEEGVDVSRLLKESKKKMGTPIPSSSPDVVHAEDWDDLMLILRVFDADLEYGPCSNTSRLERYERAVSLGLNPPPEIGQILTSKRGRERKEYAQSTFNI